MSVTVGPYRLSPEFLRRTRLRNRCRDVCATACCDGGVTVSLYEAQAIIHHIDPVQPYLEQPLDTTTWDISHPGGISSPLMKEGTAHEHCWFLMRDKRCALHAWALDAQHAVESIKPLFCILFPLTLVTLGVDKTEIAIDQMAYRTCLVEGETETWLFEQFENDLRRVIGDEGYAELTRLAAM